MRTWLILRHMPSNFCLKAKLYWVWMHLYVMRLYPPLHSGMDTPHYVYGFIFCHLDTNLCRLCNITVLPQSLPPLSTGLFAWGFQGVCMHKLVSLELNGTDGLWCIGAMWMTPKITRIHKLVAHDATSIVWRHWSVDQYYSMYSNGE